MTREAPGTSGSEHAASEAHGRSARLLCFLAASIVLHGLIAMTLAHAGADSLPGSPARSVSSLPPTEMVWFDGVGGPLSTGASAVALPPEAAAPVNEPRPAPRVVARER